MQSIFWLLCVLTPPLLSQKLETVAMPPAAPIVTLSDYRQHPGKLQIVVLPAGSTIPVKVDITGDVFRASSTSVLPLILNEPVEIMMNDGQPTGQWRLPGDSWSTGAGDIMVRIPMLKPELPQSGPEIKASLIVETQHQNTH
jgi:hypothetical protein